MRSFWSDPYLWIHLAGITTVPLWLELCWLGLAVGDPILPYWLELGIVGVIGITPILWMQWQRPFDIYSLLLLAVRVEHLTPQQRQVLTRFAAPRNRVLAIATAAALAIALYQIYVFAPLSAAITPFADQSRGVSLLIAAIAFLAANLFTQVPVAVASVMLTGETAFVSTIPLSVEDIQQRFTVFGFPVQKILPDLIVPERKAAIAVPTATTPPTAEELPSDADESWVDETETNADAELSPEIGVPSHDHQASVSPEAVEPVAESTDSVDSVESGEDLLTEVDAAESVVVESVVVESVVVESVMLESVMVESVVVESVVMESTEAIADVTAPAAPETDTPEPVEMGDSAIAELGNGTETDSPTLHEANAPDTDGGSDRASDNPPAQEPDREPDSQLDSAPATVAAEAITTEEIAADDAPPPAL